MEMMVFACTGSAMRNLTGKFPSEAFPDNEDLVTLRNLLATRQGSL